MTEKNLFERLSSFIIVFGSTIIFIYGLLPWLTGSFEILKGMSRSLDETGINPTNYYYTDVEQVIESEQYLRSALKQD